MIFENVFKVRVVYKSGYTHDFECTQFSIKGGRYEWVVASAEKRPVELGADEIAAVWQLGVRKRIKWSFWT